MIDYRWKCCVFHYRIRFLKLYINKKKCLQIIIEIWRIAYENSVYIYIYREIIKKNIF